MRDGHVLVLTLCGAGIGLMLALGSQRYLTWRKRSRR